MREQTKKLVTMALMVAISVLLVYLIRFPIFPAAPFLEYDPADIPIFIATYMYGPLSGLVVTAVTSIVQGLTVSAGSGVIGIIMHFFATGSFVLLAGFIFRKKKSTKRLILASICGTVVMTVSMVIWNIIFTPLFMGTPIEQVLPMLLPIIIPFNLIKAAANAVIAALVYRGIRQWIPQKYQSAPLS